MTHFLEQLYNGIGIHQKYIALFMDLSKSFGLINHILLKEKLIKYGFRGKINEWLMSYLSD